MSLCYDFQKWTIISLVSVAISLAVGLVIQYAHGQSVDNQTTVNYTHFSIDIPNNWAYDEPGAGATRYPDLTPSKFASFLINKSEPLNEIERWRCICFVLW
jgi:hypothetical protein